MFKITLILKTMLLMMSLVACTFSNSSSVKNTKTTMDNTQNTPQGENIEVATLGGGCFWCLEAVYQRMEGVQKIVSGYTGGTIKNPTYKEVCSGTTGHAEVIQITFDSKTVSYAQILEVFWRLHDPTTLNRQGADVGTQYRSAIFYHNEAQKEIAQKSIDAVVEAQLWNGKITTEVAMLGIFYPAEDYHQNYYNDNSREGYCVAVVAPKVEKFKKIFKEKLKKEYKD